MKCYDKCFAILYQREDKIIENGKNKNMIFCKGLDLLPILWYNNEENIRHACMNRYLTTKPIETIVEMVYLSVLGGKWEKHENMA